MLSTRFRLVVAALLWAIGVLVLANVMARAALDPLGQYGIDFADYHRAAQRLAGGLSPYAPEMLEASVPAQGQDRYRYPPLLAQSLVPTAGLPTAAVATGWLVVQAALVYASVWLAASAGGAPRTPERVLWTGTAATWFLPVFDTLWKGNVSALLAFQFALLVVAGRRGGAALASAVLLKLTPVLAVPAALARDRETRSGVLLGLALLLAVGIALAPAAWLDHLRVLPNLLGGRADYETNLAPASMLAGFGGGESVAATIRLATIAGVVAAVVASVVLAGRPGGWPAAVVLAVLAGLGAPAALWYHYLVVLLPMAALAWPAAASRQRIAIAGSAALISVGVAALPLALLGASVLAASVLLTLWPRAGGAIPSRPGLVAGSA